MANAHGYSFCEVLRGLSPEEAQWILQFAQLPALRANGDCTHFDAHGCAKTEIAKLSAALWNQDTLSAGKIEPRMTHQEAGFPGPTDATEALFEIWFESDNTDYPEDVGNVVHA